MNEKEKFQVQLTDAEIAAWKASPPISEDGLEAIRKETLEERDIAARKLVRKVFAEMKSPLERRLGRRFRYSNLRHPPQN